ncbi:uncharacterized protein EAF02_003484 [Botrytis sinoallii]|uniref:uncharacterized protein n=1 Tax=Botrytis sinoallii TaxID=1463999 RepID=UPI00190272D0|nr:uncharacterized protein EAF02_003484 [Botrytis sinoallii]KAF7886837.1 hypothetical protein EAF02_003484 [Botrytis sinoallii]
MGFNQRILQIFKHNKPFTYAELDPSHVNSDNEYQDEDRLLNRFSVGDELFEHTEKGENDTCHKHHSKIIAPILDAIDIPLSTWRLNGTFLERENESIYRQPPSPEVDAAWARIETQDPIPISREDLINQGKNPDLYAKFPESFGFGPDAFIGRIDVFHQIHCLNRLRMHLYWSVEYYYPNEQMGKYHQLHASHCVYALLQNLMCQGNVDTYGHYWVDMQENAVPDFNINHKCRDFEVILEYHDKIAVPLEKFGALRRPVDEPVRHMTHEAKEVFRWFDNHGDDGQDGTEIL